ncbi:PHB depolymerase family esterase [Leptospira sp. 96542]|nr:PHB depolymerase family esterase [Leptospira sp. 96542]
MKQTLIAVIFLSQLFCKTISFVPVNEHKYQTIVSNGDNRNFRYYLPKSQTLNLPIVFILHGGGGSGEGMIYLTRLSERAEKYGFIAVYPDGFENRWNDGRNLSFSKTDIRNTNDTTFFRNMVDYFVKHYSINTDQIHVVGISNGGLMSQRLLCEASDIFRSAYSIAATTSKNIIQFCEPKYPRSLGFIMGKYDDVIPYSGGNINIPQDSESGRNYSFGGEVLSFQNSLQFWADKNKCTIHEEKKVPRLGSYFKRDLVYQSYTNESKNLKIEGYTIPNGGHVWPHGFFYQSPSKYGYLSKDLEASEVVIQFFMNPDINQGSN